MNAMLIHEHSPCIHKVTAYSDTKHVEEKKIDVDVLCLLNKSNKI